MNIPKQNNTKKNSTSNTKHNNTSIYILPNTYALQKPHTHTHTHTHTHITKQDKTTTVQIKTNTVHDIPKLSSHNIIKYPQRKFTLTYMALLSSRTTP